MHLGGFAMCHLLSWHYLHCLFIIRMEHKRTCCAELVGRSEVAVIWELAHIVLYLLACLVGMGQETGLKLPTFPWVLLQLL